MNTVKTIVITGIILMVIGIAGSFLSYQFMDHSSSTVKETVASGHIAHLKILAKNEHVTIIPVKNRSEITVELTGKGTKKLNTELDLHVHDDTLSIKTKRLKKLFQINFFGGTRELNIYLPEKLYQSLEVSLDNGELTVNDLSIKNVKTDSNNGRIRMKHMVSDHIHVAVSNGRVHLDHVEGKITGRSDNGAVFLKTDTLDRSIDWKTDNGNIKIETEGKPENAILDLQTKNGRVSVFSSDDWNTVIGDGEYLIKLRANNGNIYIHD